MYRATKMSSGEIVRVLDNLLGNTEAVGETNADELAMSNLKKLIDVTNWCLDGVFRSSETCGRPEYSMHEVGWTARQALFEYKDWLESVCGEDSGDE